MLRYESRIEEISEDMEDLNVEEIKSQVLNTHVLPRSRAPSLSGPYVEAPSSQSYTRMDDFTAVVTATVLQALPSLSRLMALMDIWSVRLAVLRQVSPLMVSMEDAEVALRSGWKAIQTQQSESVPEGTLSNTSVLSRQDYEIMRDVLQEKVSKLGRKLDHMLDTLEGRNDTLPEAWLDRMETIEQDYGEWVVCGERKAREDEWEKVISARWQEQVRNSSSAVVNPPPSDTERDSIREHQDNILTNDTPAETPQAVNLVHTEAATSEHIPPPGPAGFDIPIIEPLPEFSGLPLFDGPKDGSLTTSAPEDTLPNEKTIPQPKDSAELEEHDPLGDNVEVSSLKTGTSLSTSAPKYVPPVEKNMPQPTEFVDLANQSTSGQHRAAVIEAGIISLSIQG